MNTQTILHSGMLALSLALLGCNSVPQTGSLAAVQDRAQRKVMESCLKTGMTTNRHLPLVMLVEMCDRTVLLHAKRQAVVGSR